MTDHRRDVAAAPPVGCHVPAIVHGIGWVDGPFGYNVHARGFFSALACRIPTAVSPLFVLEGPFKQDRESLRRLYGDHPIISVALMYGNLAGAVLRDAPGPRIIYTVWESTRLPDDWLESLTSADQVWTPSHWGAAVMARNGIDPAHIHVVPEGIDPALFHPNVTATPVISERAGFKFLHIGRFEDRKGTKTLIRAFDKEFGPRDDALLILACHNHHEPGFNIGAELRALELRRPERLVFIPPVARHDVLAGLYTACDAFVAPSRAEGWGLPIIEAMACGLPVITTDHSAPRDYLGAESYRVSCRMMPIATPFFKPSNGDFGMWAEPDVADLRRRMREIYENPATARTRGEAAGARIRSRFTWDAAAGQAVSAIAELR